MRRAPRVRLVAYGYRISEIPLQRIPEVRNDSKVVLRGNALRAPFQLRRPCAVSTGCHVRGVALMKPDCDHVPTGLAGVARRILFRAPKPDPKLLLEFGAFVHQEIRRVLVPIPAGVVLLGREAVLQWLAGTRYTQTRKDELLGKYDNAGNPYSRKYWKCKSFFKDEWYVDWKHARVISSREDVYKCVVGRMNQLIEEQLFKRPEFIKHVPVRDRPAHLLEVFGFDVAYLSSTDYTSFESLIRDYIMFCCELSVFEYMGRESAEGRFLADLVAQAQAGPQHLQFKWFTVDMDAIRESGDLDTSWGNGFTNWMLSKFMAHKQRLRLRGQFEGDDGLNKTNGPLMPELYVKLGTVVKITREECVGDASFCGQLFDMRDLTVVTDPRKVLASFGWAGKFYVNAKTSRLLELLRAKSLSFAHQYPGCPIVQSLAQYGMRVTRGKSLNWVLGSRATDSWKRDQLLSALAFVKENGYKALSRVVPQGARDLVERKFGIPVAVQVSIESYLDGLTELQPLDLPDIFPRSWREYASRYVWVGDVDCNSSPLNFATAVGNVERLGTDWYQAVFLRGPWGRGPTGKPFRFDVPLNEIRASEVAHLLL